MYKVVYFSKSRGEKITLTFDSPRIAIDFAHELGGIVVA